MVLFMSYGYSDDLRRAALACYVCGGKTQQEVSVLFGIGLKTFSRWVCLDKAGDYRCRVQVSRKRPHKIDGVALQSYICRYPDSYLKEIAQHFGVSDVGILKACRRLGIIVLPNVKYAFNAYLMRISHWEAL